MVRPMQDIGLQVGLRSVWKPEFRKIPQSPPCRPRQNDLAAGVVDFQSLERNCDHVGAEVKKAADFEDCERNVVTADDDLRNDANAFIAVVPYRPPPHVARAVAFS